MLEILQPERRMYACMYNICVTYRYAHTSNRLGDRLPHTGRALRPRCCAVPRGPGICGLFGLGFRALCLLPGTLLLYRALKHRVRFKTEFQVRAQGQFRGTLFSGWLMLNYGWLPWSVLVQALGRTSRVSTHALAQGWHGFRQYVFS